MTIHYTLQTASGALNGLSPDELGGVFSDFITHYTSPIIYQAIFTVFTVYFVSKGIKGGIEKLTKIVMPVLLVLVVVLILRGLTFPGAEEGLAFYLIPDWPAWGNFDLWSAALGQAFLSLSLGMGKYVDLRLVSVKERKFTNSKYVCFIF